MSITNLQSVKQFMRVFQQAYSDTPTDTVGPSIIKLRLKLALEELEELFFATMNRQSQKLVNIHFKQINSFIEALDDSSFSINLIDIADALTDIEYINNGTAAVFGIPLDATFREVHRSNMSKLDADGKPVFREDGKVIKSDLYSPPDLDSVLASYGYSVEKTDA